MKTTITLTMSPQLRRNLSPSYAVGRPLRMYLDWATKLIRDEGRKEAPKDLGEMRRSHTAIVDSAAIPGWGRMEVQAVGKRGAPYPIFVHEGTRPHFPPVEAIRGWAERHGIDPWVLARSIAKKGTKANPWLERTLTKVMPQLMDAGRLGTEVRKQWEKP